MWSGAGLKGCLTLLLEVLFHSVHRQGWLEPGVWRTLRATVILQSMQIQPRRKIAALASQSVSSSSQVSAPLSGL